MEEYLIVKQKSRYPIAIAALLLLLALGFKLLMLFLCAYDVLQCARKKSVHLGVELATLEY